MAATNSTAREKKAARERARYLANRTEENLARRAAYSLSYYYATRDSVTPEQRAKKAEYQKAWHETNKERLKVVRADYHKAYNAANREKQKAWRDANKEKLKVYLIEYHKANKEKHDATMRAHYVANAEAYKARAREWKIKNPEKFKEMRARERAANPEKFKEISRRDWLKHGEKRRAAHAARRKLFPEKGAHHCRLRQTRKQKATPTWADLNAIKAVYKQAAELRKQTGTKWHVDHEIPLKHPLVSGLHVHTNLRVIPGAENQSKGNAFIV